MGEEDKTEYPGTEVEKRVKKSPACVAQLLNIDL